MSRVRRPASWERTRSAPNSGDVVLSPRSCGSLTETARLLQNVRSVFSRRSATRAHMELELSHGFAFSQEEGGSVSQADVIRAYDTSQPRPTHS